MSKDILYIAIPTRDYRASINSINALILTAIELGRTARWVVCHGGFVTQTRTECLNKVKEFTNKDSEWIFWLDDDIILDDNPKRIAELILKAENTNKSWTADYKTLIIDREYKPRGICFKSADEVYSDEELKNAKDFELKVHHSGLGLCYIKTPLNYKFVWDERGGEDRNFFADNKEVDLRFCRLNAYHEKMVLV